MKNYIIAAALVALISSPTWAAVSIVNSKHDMVASGFAAGNTEICVFCHTPHGAQTTSVTQAQLWNNTPVAVGVIQLSDLYVGQQINFTYTQASVDATDARLCLSCHGNSGVGMPVNQPASGALTPTAATMGANTVIGTNLSNDHPIGMDLGPTPQFNPSSAVVSGLNTLAQIKINFGNEDPFPGDLANDTVNVMWCSTCHNVHDSDPLKAPFLRKSNVGSALCKACHIK